MDLLRIMSRWLVVAVLLAGCGASDPWRQDGIAAGNTLFDSKRLCYAPLGGYPPWRIELLRVEDQVEAFLSLTQHSFRGIDGSARVRLRVEGEEEREELAQVFEGNMKIKLSEEFTRMLILALQEGKKVSILVDEWQETLFAGSFKKKFIQLMDKGQDWLNIQMPVR